MAGDSVSGDEGTVWHSELLGLATGDDIDSLVEEGLMLGSARSGSGAGGLGVSAITPLCTLTGVATVCVDCERRTGGSWQATLTLAMRRKGGVRGDAVWVLTDALATCLVGVWVAVDTAWVV